LIRGHVVLDCHVLGSVDGRTAAAVDAPAAGSRSAINAPTAGAGHSAGARANATRADTARADTARANATGCAHDTAGAGDDAPRTSTAASA